MVVSPKSGNSVVYNAGVCQACAKRVVVTGRARVFLMGVEKIN